MEIKSDFPKNGVFSGMIFTAATALIVVPLGLLYEPFAAALHRPLTPELLNFFFLSIVLMALHKVESFFAREYDHCPVYLTNGAAPWAQNPRKAIFLSFVPTFIGMLFFSYLAFLGPRWHLMLLAVWLGQGLHEFHHLGKTLARRRIYPGFFSSLAFVGVMSFAVFPLWHDLVFSARGAFFYAYYALLPLVLAAFYGEDRMWFGKAREFFPSLARNEAFKSEKSQS